MVIEGFLIYVAVVAIFAGIVAWIVYTLRQVTPNWPPAAWAVINALIALIALLAILNRAGPLIGYG